MPHIIDDSKKASGVIWGLFFNGWTELISLIPDGHQDKCGPKLKNPNNKKDKEGETVDNVNGSVKEKGGTRKKLHPPFIP